VHVPYKGVSGAVIDMVAGTTQMMFASPVTVLPQTKAGRLRALAVTTAARAKSMPDLPTVRESGVEGYEFSSWYGLLAPRAVPPPIIATLNQAVSRVLRQHDVQARLAADGAEAAGGAPEEFAEFLRQQMDKYAKLVKELNLRIE
jgi:tripartite-type tricarboxylate transporter receptor subunit TctC